MNCLFFVHVPKTAGTSFRIAAENYFGANRVSFDYGSHSGKTSDDVMQYVYKQPDTYLLKKELERKNTGFLTGHVGVQKYNPIISPLNTATFLRDPYEQVVSHFEHFVRHMNYKHSLQEFIVTERFANIQSKTTGALPMGLYGFVGVTERYNESVDLFNANYGVEFEKLSLNTKAQVEAKQPIYNSVSELDEETKDLIKRHNQRDLDKYNQLQKLFNSRVDMLKQNQPWVYGVIREQTLNHVDGVAYYDGLDDAVELQLYRNGEEAGEFSATRFKPNMQKLNTPRNACIGFHHDFENPLEPEEVVEVRVKNTGQLLISDH